MTARTLNARCTVCGFRFETAKGYPASLWKEIDESRTLAATVEMECSNCSAELGIDIKTTHFLDYGAGTIKPDRKRRGGGE